MEKADISYSLIDRLDQIFLEAYPVREDMLEPMGVGERVLVKLKEDRGKALYSLLIDLSDLAKQSHITPEEAAIIREDMDIVYKLFWKQILKELARPNMKTTKIILVNVRDEWVITRSDG